MVDSDSAAGCGAILLSGTANAAAGQSSVIAANETETASLFMEAPRPDCVNN
jgi:hypothetical protein